MLETWSRLSDAPFARVNHQAIILNDFLYVFGGFNSQLKDLQYCIHQLDVFKWDINNNLWEEVKYPLCLKSWDCSTNSWGSDPLISADGSIQPTLRFGHTVVAWRGRGWLFGGRTQQHVCSNQLYMFYPGGSPFSAATGIHGDSDDPLWAEVIDAHGSVPTARDGHAATVLDSSMFIFGGYEDVFNGYDNLVYRLDFLSWTWTRIQIVSQLTRSPSTLPGGNSARDTDPIFESGGAGGSSVSSAPTRDHVIGDTADPVEAEEEGSLRDVVVSTRVPLPRDFACLMSHQGRIFLFGGRSECSSRSRHDVYDSALWELVPVASQQQNDDGAREDCRRTRTVSDVTAGCAFTADRISPACCPTRFADWRHMAWEEESGNWENSSFWATSSARPSCLWGLFSPGSDRTQTAAACTAPTPPCRQLPSASCPSRWATSEAVWQRRHAGHGLQLPDHLLPRLFRSAHHSSAAGGSTAGGVTARGTGSTASVNTASPYGRRSLSHWCYGGYLYIAFGTVRCQTGDQWQLHYEDVWRFHLATDTWSLVSYSVTPTASDNNRDGVRAHRPSARRRGVACLHLPRPSRHRQGGDSLSRPRVFLFGGTQPCLLTRHDGPSSEAAARWTNTSPLQAQRCLSGPLRLAHLFPRLTDAQAVASLARQLSGSDATGGGGVGAGEPLTQNRLLPLLSLGGNPRQLTATVNNESIGGNTAYLPPLRSPYVILLVEHTQNPVAERCGILLHLVVVMPPLSTQATINSSPGSVPPLACLCVASLSDCVSFIQTGHYFKGAGFLSRLFTAAESDVASRSSTSSLSEPMHSLSPDECIHLRTALHLALTAVDDSGAQRIPSSRPASTSVGGAGGGGHLPLRLSLVVQQTVMEPEMFDPTAVRYPSDLMMLPYASGSSMATLLEQQIFYLPIRDSSGEAGISPTSSYSDPLDGLRSQVWFRRLPSSRLALYTALYLLRDAARLLSAGQPGDRNGAEESLGSSGLGESVGTSAGAASNSSSTRGCVTCRPRPLLPSTTALCYDCYFGTGSGDSPSVSPARVLIDASQLTLTVSRSAHGEQAPSDGVGGGTDRSLASILTQRLLSHVRVGIELLPMMMVMMDSQLLVQPTGSTSWPLELFVSRTTSLAPFPSANSSVSFSSSCLLVPQNTPDLGPRNELTSDGGQGGDFQEDAEMLEEQAVGEPVGGPSQQPVDFSTSSAADWSAQLLVDHHPHVRLEEQGEQRHPIRQHHQPARGLADVDAGIDVQMEADAAESNSSSSMSSSLNESADHAAGSVFCLPGIGVLVTGKERLVELNDCYVMHLDTTLYDLCLRRLRALRPSIQVLLTLPSRILHDLAALHYTSGLPECFGREANSG